MARGDDDVEEPGGPPGSAEPRQLQVGDLLGRYKILRKLGQGGMGEVFAAEDPTLDREVAIKVLPPAMAAHKEVVHRFEREAQAIAKLEHPNIVTIYSVERCDGVEFLSMQLVEGETLRGRIKKGGLPLYEFYDLAIQMADAVGAAHERGIIHRDLKPENILVTKDERVMILDFGLAKLRDEFEPRGIASSRANLTNEGVLIGTMDYMSPEQAEGREVDHRTDIFSLAIVLYELVTGEHPFKGESSISVISSIMKDAPRSITQIDGSLPDHLDRIFRMALEKNREQRIQSTKDLRNQLESLKRESSANQSPVPAARASRSPIWSRGFGVGAACGVLVACVAVWLMGGLASEEMRIEFGDNRRIAGDAELELQPAISPSGKMVAYVRGPTGQRRLYVRHVAGGRPVALTEQYEGSHLAPQWSPDEEVIVFEADKRRWIVTPFPGDRRELEGATGSGGLAWSPDGSRIVYPRDSELLVRPFAGGEERVLVTTHEPHSPSWSPDGTRIAFVSGNWQNLYSSFVPGNIAPSKLWIVPVEGGEAVEILADGSMNLSPQWLDENHLLFLSDKHGTNDLYLMRVAASGEAVGVPRRITTGLNSQSFSLSVDVGRIAYSEFTTRANIWKLPIPRETLPASNRDAVQLTFGSQIVEGIAVSADRNYLLFDSNRDGNQDIYKLDLDDGEPHQLTVDLADDFMPEESPAGDEIAFYSFRTGNRDLFVMSTDGTNLVQVTDDPAHDRYPTWSPDAKSLVYHSDSSGSQELWTVSRAQRGEPWGEPRLLTTGGGQHGRWSPDGETVLFGRDFGCWVVPAAGGESRELAGEGMALGWMPMARWSPDGETAYLKSWDRLGRATIWGFSSDGADPQQLVLFDDRSKSSGRAEFAVDEENFYFTIAEQSGDVFTLDLFVSGGGS